MSILPKAYWNKIWSKHKPEIVRSVLFEEVFERFLSYNPKLRCIEVGCVPGAFLIFFHKKFGYQIFGLDYSDEINIVHENMKLNGVREYKLFRADFLKWATDLKFDVVCSFGFIEHFRNYEEVLKKHFEILKKGGLLILSVPNFGFGRILLHILFRDYHTLLRHNLKLTNLKTLKNALQGQFQIIYLNYYRTFGFWMGPDAYDNLNAVERVLLSIINLIPKILRKVKLSNIPNRFFSPYIICLARKI